MIYEQPKLRSLGDCYVGVEFGDEASLLLNFRVLALMDALKASPMEGIVDLVPSLRELAVVLDRTATTPRRIVEGISERLRDLDHEITLRSRRFTLPVWYDDPWSREIAERNGEPMGCELVASRHGLTVEKMIERHTGTDHWCACVGWGPGCYFCYPMDPSRVLSAPKLRTAREFCAVRMLNMGGACTAAMPVDGPSGYTMLGRLAVNIYEPEPCNAIFPENGVLFRASDRHRYRSVSGPEYEEILSRVTEGTYEYEVEEEDFDTRAYTERFASSERVASTSD